MFDDDLSEKIIPTICLLFLLIGLIALMIFIILALPKCFLWFTIFVGCMFASMIGFLVYLIFLIWKS